ncbi:MAG: ABC transporter permease [Bacteroidota bacterium]|jgi:ABC-2 type transport system permease protein|nr:ABC transporter permease [Bacteroidota bacterium]
MKSYSNLTALRALIKASLQSIFKSPSAIVFGVAFPLIFIMVFGFLGGGKDPVFSVANALTSDTTVSLNRSLHQVPQLKWKSFATQNEIDAALQNGTITATIAIEQPIASQPAQIVIQAASSGAKNLPALQAIVKQVIQLQDPSIQQKMAAIANVQIRIQQVRAYKSIDFILPGQLGFSLLAGSVFGTAFVFFNLRQTLVLKRFFATPVRKEIIVVSEGIARMLFQLLTSLVIIVIGHFAFGFTLVNGFWTGLEMLLLSALGIIVFMGFGFVVSGLAKTDATIPPIANLITLPQFLLAGTFFSIDNFPKWLQPITKAMPLTYLNDAMRKIAFDGAHLWDVKADILVLCLFGLGIYLLASRVFKWE